MSTFKDNVHAPWTFSETIETLNDTVVETSKLERSEKHYLLRLLERAEQFMSIEKFNEVSDTLALEEEKEDVNKWVLANRNNIGKHMTHRVLRCLVQITGISEDGKFYFGIEKGHVPVQKWASFLMKEE